MPYVYILKERKQKRFYIGSCVDIKKRFLRHQNHTGGQTTKKGIWIPICFKLCETIEEARKLEKKIKSYKGGNGLKKIVNGEVAEWSKAAHC